MTKSIKLILGFIGIIAICLFLLYLLPKNNQEGFRTLSPVTYSSTTITDYNNIQNNTGLSVAELQTMGVPESDTKSFISNGTWPWSSGFTNAIQKLMLNTPNTDPSTISSTLTSLQKNAPEEFYIVMLSAFYGFGFRNIATSKQLGCAIDPSTNKVTGDTLFTLDGNGNVTSTSVANSQLPTLIPGFVFLEDPCNPCTLENLDFSCPYAYPDAAGSTLYPGFVMDYLWDVSNNSKDSSGNSSTMSISSITTEATQMFHKYVW